MEAIRSGKPVKLTSQEFKLLKYLASSADRVVSREELLAEVKKHPSPRTVDNYILSLRQKLEPYGGGDDHRSLEPEQTP